MNIYIEEIDSGVTCGPFDTRRAAHAAAKKSNEADASLHWVVRGDPVEDYLNANKRPVAHLHLNSDQLGKYRDTRNPNNPPERHIEERPAR